MEDRHRPISPSAAAGTRGKDLPAYLSNGLIGLRIRENPLQSGMCIVSSFAGEHPERVVEALCPAPYPLAGNLAVDGVWTQDASWRLEPVDQTIDFATGELTTRLKIVADDVEVEIECLTFCSRRQPTVVCQELRVTASRACRLGWRAMVDLDPARGALRARLTETPGEAEPACDGALRWEADGGLSSCGVGYVTDAPAGAGRAIDDWNRTGPLKTEYDLRLKAGRPARLRQIASLVPSAMHAQPHLHAIRLVAHAKEVGFDQLRAENKACWDILWRSRIRLVGAERRWQALADAAMFYLNASTHPSSPSSTSIFGLAAWPDYHYYFGHVMWDVDAFAIPVLSLIQPGAARALLDFRSRGVQAARDNARLHGLEGLQFPWEAAPATGQEATPGAATAMARELHLNLHVARAFAFHSHATGNGRFLREAAWPVLAGVSDWLVDRAEPGCGGLHLRGIGGPAETVEPVDDDALTLMAGRLILREARAVAGRLGEAAPAAWATVAAGLHPPLRADGVIASHAGYRVGEEKGATPSVLTAFFPYWAEVDAATMQKTLRFYLDQWEDYVGSPMLAALYGAWAAWAGDRRLSLKLLDEGYARYIHGRFDQTLEYRLDKIDGVAAGPFVANIGGFLSGLLMGLPGLRVDAGDPAAWPARAVVLPLGWEAIECDAVHVRGEVWRLVARHGVERAEFGPAQVRLGTRRRRCRTTASGRRSGACATPSSTAHPPPTSRLVK